MAIAAIRDVTTVLKVFLSLEASPTSSKTQSAPTPIPLFLAALRLIARLVSSLSSTKSETEEASKVRELITWGEEVIALPEVITAVVNTLQEEQYQSAGANTIIALSDVGACLGGAIKSFLTLLRWHLCKDPSVGPDTNVG